jgi:hypothetical protein
VVIGKDGNKTTARLSIDTQSDIDIIKEEIALATKMTMEATDILIEDASRNPIVLKSQIRLQWGFLETEGKEDKSLRAKIQRLLKPSRGNRQPTLKTVETTFAVMPNASWDLLVGKKTIKEKLVMGKPGNVRVRIDTMACVSPVAIYS